MMSRSSSLLQRLSGRWTTIVVVVIAFGLGILLGGGDETPPTESGAAGRSKVKWYTCAMHPQIKLQDPKAPCPICGMELIPVMEDSGGVGPRQLSMSEGARVLAEVRTTPVERRMVVKEVRLVGKVDYDETRMRTITAWVSGRLDRLYINYTGVAVQKGAPLVYMYSPELLVAQRALLEADAAYEEMRTSAAANKNVEMQRGTVKALEDRLRLWGLADDQIAEIRKRGTASDHMTIRSPISGIVIQKEAVEGAYVKVGEKIYDIADLSRIWVYLDAYESDLAWIKYAQEVEFEAEAYQGEVFRGRISFIDPFLDEKTRTVKVRVTVDNVDGRLKPGMFVRARILAKLAEKGRIVEPSLAGKWISPVHPEVVMDEVGNCPICGTPLVSAESLGYVGEDARPPLVIPASAPLRTGKRAVVYVRVPGTERPTFEGREIALGPRTQDYYIVSSGLEEGELVVSNGAFKIDSALQILAKPSMMSLPDDEEGTTIPKAFREGISRVVHPYLDLGEALSRDDLKKAVTAAAAVEDTLSSVPAAGLDAKSRERWCKSASALREAASTLRKATDLEAARRPFVPMSDTLANLLARFGHAGPEDLFELHCPMAFSSRGADWVQRGKETRNPYFGASMYRCGGVTRSLPREPKD